MLKEGVILGERYEIISRIGSGGMADVYKAKDHKLNRMVAVKVLKPEFREDKTFIRKFRTEAQAAAGLSHPNIVNVYDVGEDRGVYYIVMELVEGITLKDYIDRKGKLSVKEATSIAIQVSLGLEAAHNRNIVHRDVKPQNIIISTDGKVKLSDFGIAKATSSNTISSNVMGSVHYSSPEQVRGGYSDYKSDIYSLGITMYEMVTGRVPFDGDTTVAIAIKHLQEEIESPSKYTPNLPFALEQIILKCTQKSPDRRYNNMAELIDDLKHSLMEPQGNFVKVTPLSSHAETVMVSAEELSQIRSGAAAKANAQTAEEPARKRYSKIEDEEEDEDYSYEDEVMEVDPAIGTKVKKGSDVTIYVNSPSAQPTTPDENTPTPTPAEPGANTATDVTWSCSQTLSAPDQYQGGIAKIELIQDDGNGNETSITIMDGQAITSWPYSVNTNWSASSSASSTGRIVFYEMDSSGSYQAIAQYQSVPLSEG